MDSLSKKLLGVFFVLLLSGCSREVAYLTFDTSALNHISSSSVDRDLSVEILTLLEEQGVDVTGARMRLAKDDPKTVILTLPESEAEPAKLQRIEQALGKILAARKALSLGVSFTLDRAAEELKAEQVPEVFETNFTFEDDLVLTKRKIYGDMLVSMLVGEEPKASVYCNASIQLDESLPFNAFFYEATGNNKVEYYVWIEGNKHKVKVRFHNEELQSMFTNGVFTLIEPPVAKQSSSIRDKAEGFYLDFGRVGEVKIDNRPKFPSSGSFSREPYATMENRCHRRLVESDRLFTFFSGLSIDRLVSVNILYE